MAADLGTLDSIRDGADRLMRIISPWAIPVCTAALLIPGLSLVADVGLLPILMVVLIWGALQVSYTLERIRLDRRRSQ